MQAVQERSTRAIPALVSNGLFKDGNTAFVDSRFGKIRINLEKAVFFPNGLLGMPDKMNYCLADFPDPLFAQFKILQSIDDIELSFITLPLDENGNHPSFHFIEKKDLESCSNALHIARENMAIILVTTVHRTIDSKDIKLSVNVRAPLIIDTQSGRGIQYVFQNNKYQVRQMLNDIM